MILSPNLWGELRDRHDNNVWDLVGAGAPTNGTSGTGVSVGAGPGSTYTNVANGDVYHNSNTALSPTWNKFFDNSGALPTISASNAVSALAGGGQAGATLLASAINRVSTVATDGDSVALPVSAAGMTVVVINNGAKALQVFGSGTDTIDGVATAVGVSQLKNSAVLYFCTAAGAWFSIGLSTGFGSLGLETQSISPNLTATGGGTQAAALALTNLINRVGTVAANGDSVRLPVSVPGMVVVIINKGAFALQAFGAGTETINGIATATGVPQSPNTIVAYYCSVAGNWETTAAGMSNLAPQALSVNGAINPHQSGTYVITKAGVLADTLAAPTDVTDDGVIIDIVSNTANAHTLTFTGNTLDSGSAAVLTITFNAFKGAGCRLMAQNARWKLMSGNGISVS